VTEESTRPCAVVICQSHLGVLTPRPQNSTTARTPIVPAALRDEDRGTVPIAQPSAPSPQPPDPRLLS